jgi:hypothetical protein
MRKKRTRSGISPAPGLAIWNTMGYVEIDPTLPRAPVSALFPEAGEEEC